MPFAFNPFTGTLDKLSAPVDMAVGIQLNDNFISNDGDSEGIKILDSGVVDVYAEGLGANMVTFLRLNNMSASSVTNTQTAIEFTQKESTFDVIVPTAKIVAGTNGNFGTYTSTHDSYLKFMTSINGSMNESFRVSPVGNLQMESGNDIIGSSSSSINLDNSKVTLKFQNTNSENFVFSASNADPVFKIQSAEDEGDYFSILVQDDGQTKISTYDLLGDPADLHLLVRGGIDIEATDGIITLGNGGIFPPRYKFGVWDDFTYDFKIVASINNYFSLLSAASGATIIKTHDQISNTADLTLDADGDIILKKTGGTFTPSSDNHAATKKYVDDEITAVTGGGEANEYSFKTISITGQVDVVADSTTDTLTLIAGQNLSMTTSASDEITINSLPYPHNHSGVSTTAEGITDGYVLTADGADGAAWEAASGGGMGSLVQDTTPQLGGNLNLNSFGITFPDAGTVTDCLHDNPVNFPLNASQSNIASSSTISNYIEYTASASINKYMAERMATVEDWWSGRTSMNAINLSAPAPANWGNFTWREVLGCPATACRVIKWQAVSSFSSSEPYDISLWKIAFAEGQNSSGATITQIGTTLSFNGGSNCVAYRVYHLAEAGLSADVGAGEVIFHCVRYMDGSGTKYAYGNISVWTEGANG